MTFIFFRGVETTNQFKIILNYLKWSNLDDLGGIFILIFWFILENLHVVADNRSGCGSIWICFDIIAIDTPHHYRYLGWWSQYTSFNRSKSNRGLFLALYKRNLQSSRNKDVEWILIRTTPSVRSESWIPATGSVCAAASE